MLNIIFTKHQYVNTVFVRMLAQSTTVPGAVCVGAALLEKHYSDFFLQSMFCCLSSLY